MRTILVLATGGDTDKAVFDTALTAARRLEANLEFLHMRIASAEAAAYTPHVGFAVGSAVRTALADLDAMAGKRASAALHHFEELCEREKIDIAIRPTDPHCPGASASWCEQCDDAAGTVIRWARHNDLAVVGRGAAGNGLPFDLLEQVLMESGRPLLIAPNKPRRQLTGTVLVCWKETAESARALNAALPILKVSQRIVIANVEEAGSSSPQGLYHLAQRLEWNGIVADPQWLRASSQSVANRLRSLATEIDADLLVMGGYGHGRLREMVLGGCTLHFLEHGDRPVLLMH